MASPVTDKPDHEEDDAGAPQADHAAPDSHPSVEDEFVASGRQEYEREEEARHPQKVGWARGAIVWVDAHHGAATAIATAVYTVATVALFWLAWRQSKQTERAFVESERPWIVPGQPASEGVERKGDALMFSFTVPIEALGHSPAFQVEWNAEVFPVLASADGVPVGVAKAQLERAEGATCDALTPLAGDMTIFPDDRHTSFTARQSLPAAIFGGGDQVDVWFIVCLSYKTGVDDSPHRTRFSYLISTQGGSSECAPLRITRETQHLSPGDMDLIQPRGHKCVDAF